MLALRVGEELAEFSVLTLGIVRTAAKDQVSVKGFVLPIVGVCAVAAASLGCFRLLLS